MPMVRNTVLDNGLTVVTEEIDTVRSISIGVWVRCGSRYESAADNGMAHFIEHMLFKGTERRSAFDIAAAIDSVGGVMNAFTGKELTSLYIKVPDYHLPLAMDLLADILRQSRFAAEEIEKEKAVVRQEIHMLEDSPDEYVHEIFEKAFWGGHALGRSILGTKEQVAGFTREGLNAFFDRMYRGRNMVLSAAGHLDHAAFLKQVETAFGALPEGRRQAFSDAPTTEARQVVQEKDLEQVHLVVGTVAPAARSPERYAGFLLNAVFGGSMSSRLFQEVREKRGLAYAIQSYLVPYQDTGILGVYAGAGADRLDEVATLIRAEMSRLRRTPLTADELQAAKELIKGNFLLSMESTDHRMTRLAKNELCLGRQTTAEDVLAAVDAVTSEDVVRLAGELFRSETLSVAVMGPVPSRQAFDFRMT
ncbi:MAG TPA: pitrilysin family protein [Syntrophales bacterium]|nr:pitrilysin family protein [Syntrophales bacterium]